MTPDDKTEREHKCPAPSCGFQTGCGHAAGCEIREREHCIRVWDEWSESIESYDSGPDLILRERQAARAEGFEQGWEADKEELRNSYNEKCQTLTMLQSKHERLAAAAQSMHAVLGHYCETDKDAYEAWLEGDAALANEGEGSSAW